MTISADQRIESALAIIAALVNSEHWEHFNEGFGEGSGFVLPDHASAKRGLDVGVDWLRDRVASLVTDAIEDHPGSDSAARLHLSVDDLKALLHASGVRAGKAAMARPLPVPGVN